uniref:IP05116p n=1 Tax=Drosophila melanogaster TaxID=7227 RepID=Q4V6E1_DROME|nr:IP05116p [Drosophila melanogaster]
MSLSSASDVSIRKLRFLPITWPKRQRRPFTSARPIASVRSQQQQSENPIPQSSILSSIRLSGSPSKRLSADHGQKSVVGPASKDLKQLGLPMKILIKIIG